MIEQTAIVMIDDQFFNLVKALVMDAVDSPHTKAAYGRAIDNFLTWYLAEGNPGLNKATVNRYKTEILEASGLSPATVNQRLSAIRKLAAEASDNGLLDQQIANGIGKVKGAKSAGVRTGNWLTKDQAEQLINAPDISKFKGLRDRAILAVLIGTGIRRSELVHLTFDHVQQREGRWAIVDLVGKHNRIRTVPMPSWAKAAIDYWTGEAGISSGHVFRPIHKGGWLTGESMTPQAVYYVVKEHIEALGLDIAPHDLRRTFSKLAYKGGAKLDQIQLTLGHASIKTTERYLGVQQNLTEAPCDVLGLDISGD